jgi:hypothetical protein
MTEKSSIRKLIGSVTGGGLKENLQVRLSVPPQQVQEGSFIVIDSQEWFFYGIATDLQLQAVDPRYALEPSRQRLPENLAVLLDQQTLYTNLVVLPALMLEQEPADPEAQMAWHKAIEAGDKDKEPIPCRQVHPHAHADSFWQRRTWRDLRQTGKEGNFRDRDQREQDHPVCVNLKTHPAFVGIFGATGRQVLPTRMLWLVERRNRASVQVYDMHKEYGRTILLRSGLKRAGLAAALVQPRCRWWGGRGAAIAQRADFNLVQV